MMQEFYKVIVLEIGLMETTITDERHFSTEAEAKDFAGTATGYTILVRME